jgi:hypothetical protein
MWRRHMRLRCGVMRRLGLRAAVPSMLRVGNGEGGERQREQKDGKKKAGPAREDIPTTEITRDTAALRRGASGYRALSFCAPRHEGPSFSIERRAAPPPI